MHFWNKKIISFEDEYFGMDLSDFSVKVFQLEKNGDQDKIRSFNSREISAGLIEDGKILNKEMVCEIIKDVIKTSGPKKINTKKVVCSIPESKVFLRKISIPEVNQEEAEEAIKWEIEASIPLMVDQIYFDWQFLDKKDGKQDVLTASVAKEAINDLMDVLESCGLSVYGLEMESIATVRSLVLKNSKKEDISILVDLGAEKTSFIVTEGNIPYFTSSIPFSAAVITEAISSILNITQKEAEKIKISQGINHSLENDSVFNALVPLLENLSAEIEKSMDFYQNMSKSNTEVKKIIITGGGANLKGLISYFSVRLFKEVVFGNPWANLNLGKNLPIISKQDSARYATAVGLAMRGIDYGNNT